MAPVTSALVFASLSRLVATPVLVSYYIEEMVAALALFTVLFICLAVLAGVLLILDRISGAMIALMESGGKQVLRHVRHWGVMPEPRAKF